MKKSEKIKLVKKAHKQMQELAKKRDKIFDRLLDKLGIDPIVGDDNALFDYLFNDFSNAKFAVENTEFPE